MAALGVPTTRALSLVATGDQVGGQRGLVVGGRGGWAAGWLTARLGGGQEHPLRTHTTHPHHTPTATPTPTHTYPHTSLHPPGVPRHVLQRQCQAGAGCARCLGTCLLHARGWLPASMGRRRAPARPSYHPQPTVPARLPAPSRRRCCRRGGVPRRALLHPLRNTPAARQQVGWARAGAPGGACRAGGRTGVGKLDTATHARAPPCLPALPSPLRAPTAPALRLQGQGRNRAGARGGGLCAAPSLPTPGTGCAAALGPEHWVGGQHWTQGCLCRQHWSPGWPPAVPQLAPTPPRRPTAPPRCTNLYLCTPPARPRLAGPGNKYAALLTEVAQRTGRLFAEWHRVGFVHGTRGLGACCVCGAGAGGAAGGAWLARRAARRRGAG